MDLAQTVTNAIVVGAVGITLGFLVHGLRAEVRAFRAEVRQDIGDLRREMGDLRSDLTQVALAVGVRRRPTGA